MGMVDWEPTELRLSASYILFYNHWTRLLLTGILPFIHLLLLNTKICMVLTRRSSQQQLVQQLGEEVRKEGALQDEKGRSLSCPSTTSTKVFRFTPSSKEASLPIRPSWDRSKSSVESTEGILLRVHCTQVRRQESNGHMVATMALVYLLTHSPRLATNLAECWIQPELSACPQPPPSWLNLLVLISHGCLTLNSSLNFLIYFGFSRKFQQDIVSLLGKDRIDSAGEDYFNLCLICLLFHLFSLSLLIL